MGQKFAAYNEQGSITAFYDSTDSPPPKEAQVLAITDDQWQTVLATSGYTVVAGVLTPPGPAASLTLAQLQGLVVAKVQQRLDDFAATRGYDGILSACTYATSTVAKFQAEGQYCVGARDATWSACYAGLAAVQTGTQPMPATVDAAIAQLNLPVLTWPAGS